MLEHIKKIKSNLGLKNLKEFELHNDDTTSETSIIRLDKFQRILLKIQLKNKRLVDWANRMIDGGKKDTINSFLKEKGYIPEEQIHIVANNRLEQFRAKGYHKRLNNTIKNKK